MVVSARAFFAYDQEVATRRQLLKATGMTAVSLLGRRLPAVAETADYSLTIGPCALEVAPRKFIRTTAYNNQVPGPLLRMREGAPVTVHVTNQSSNNEVVHWHGLFLPPE